MRLIDTNLWFKYYWRLPLPGELEAVLHAGELALSPISILEVATLLRRGKIAGCPPLKQWLAKALVGYALEPITPEIAAAAGSDPWEHQDPADRLIVNTAITSGLTLVHSDAVIHKRKDVSQQYFKVQS